MADAAKLRNAFRSERLLFRAIEDSEADKEWFYTQIQSDPLGFALLDSNLLRPQTRSRSDAKLADIQQGLLGVLICLPSPTTDVTDSSAGSTPIGVLSLDDEAGSNYRHHHRLAVLSIAIAPGYQGHGYGAEAIRWAMDWAFERANIHSLSLGCVEYNERAKHLYEKLGFVLEGRLRKCHFHERKWWDVLLFSMLEDEWEALKGKKA
ncbi:putative Acyl-CoA N-acyltransferase [Seiridium cardinale]|uniref:Acyl-CoA N-acyltransferase n=1 Tax=Seiridium cardinale TaxID=138064 RepID=A0ABR2XLK6_9PEZI